MSTAVQDLTPWLNRVKKATSRSEVFKILDEFRQSPWTNEQCSTMAKIYIRVVERLGDDPAAAETKPADTAKPDDGPVWYEKM
jgi:hypothetical protein